MHTVKPLDTALLRAAAEQTGAIVTIEEHNIHGGLGAAVSGGDDRLEVEVPTARPDIEREIDLVEEIARIRGLEAVPSRLPRIQCATPDREEYEIVGRSREIMTALGLDEAITYSFVPDGLLEALGAHGGIVRLANPLNAERDALRTTLLAGLLESARRAHTRFVASFGQFEVGHAFLESGEELPREETRIAAVLSGPRRAWLGESDAPVDFYDAKGIAEDLVRRLTSVDPTLDPASDLQSFHPLRACRVLVGGEEVGSVGEIHPSVLAHLKLPRGAVGMEMSLIRLAAHARRPAASHVPEYPPMARDVALMVGEERDAGPIAEALGRACGQLAVAVRLFDVYRGEGIPEGRKSLAFSVTYRAPDRTLTDAEVDEAHRAAVESVAREFSATVR